MKLTKLDLGDISSLYDNGMSTTDISKKYGTKYGVIYNFLDRNGRIIKKKENYINRTKNVDLSFFENIDSNVKAYVLGLICSDGHIHKSGYQFSLVSKNIEMVENFRTILKSNHKIRKREVYLKETNKTYTLYEIDICSKKMVNDLNKLGITNNKSFNGEMPNIDDRYFWDFLRGLFDGDGSVSGRDGKLKVTFIASTPIMKKIKVMFNGYGLSDTKLSIIAKNDTGTVYNLKQNSYKDILFIRENIYKSIATDNPFFLKRKFDIFQTLRCYKRGVNSHKNKIWKPVIVKFNGIETEYPNIKECCLDLKLNMKCVYAVLAGVRKQHKGYIFRYEGNPNFNI